MSPVERRPSRVAVVLQPRVDGCLVSFGPAPAEVGYAAPFHARADTLQPGHLVAVTTAATAATPALIIWRWFDAVVLEQAGDRVRLWEPAHGEVTAQARVPGRVPPVGSRAYASAGLPGADWWVEGPSARPDLAEVAVGEVEEFYTAHGLWQLVP